MVLFQKTLFTHSVSKQKYQNIEEKSTRENQQMATSFLDSSNDTVDTPGKRCCGSFMLLLLLLCQLENLLISYTHSTLHTIKYLVHGLITDSSEKSITVTTVTTIKLFYQTDDHLLIYSFMTNNYNNNRFTALCLGLPV